MKSNPEYGVRRKARNIILHKGMTIDLLEPDRIYTPMYTESYSIKIFETMELDSGVYGGSSFFFFLAGKCLKV